MFRDKYHRYFVWGVTAFLVIIASILFFFFMFYIPNIVGFLKLVMKLLSPILWGLVLAYVLTPIVKRVERLGMHLFQNKVKNQRRLLMASRWVGILVSLGLLVACVVLLLALILPEIGASISRLYKSFPEYVKTIELWLSELLEDNPEIRDIVMQNVDKLSLNLQENLGAYLDGDMLAKLNDVISNVTTGVIGFLKEVMNLAVGLIVSTYLMSRREIFCGQAKKLLYAILKPAYANTFLDVMRHTDKIFGGFIIGKLLDSLIIGILCFVSISLMKMPYIMLISVVVGITNIIPFFGPFIGGIPCTLLVFMINPKQGIIFGFFILALQQLDGNIIGPKILGDSTGLSAFWVVFAILLGGGLFGFIGMVLGVPTFAVFYYLLKRHAEYRLRKKNLPIDTSTYHVLNYMDTNAETVKPAAAKSEEEVTSSPKESEENSNESI